MVESTRLSTNELERMLKKAIEALDAPSPVLEKAAKMSKLELQQQIDKHIDMIASGEYSDDALEHLKIEARTMAIRKLRRF